MSLVTIDNSTFDVGIIRIERTAQMKQESLGTTMDLRKHYDVQGTYYDYDVEFYTRRMNVNDYDALYELVTTPQESHVVTLPFGQSTITFEAKTSVATDSIISKNSQKTMWGSLKIKFEALTPQREV